MKHNHTLQPTDQGLTDALKEYYLCQTFSQAIEATEYGQTLKEFWKGIKILNVIWNIIATWEKVTQQYINDIWKKILKTYGNTFKGFNKNSTIGEIVIRYWCLRNS